MLEKTVFFALSVCRALKTSDASMEVRESCSALSSPCDAGHLDART